MTTNTYATALSSLGYDAFRYLRYLALLFSGVSFRGRSLIDIGGGNGVVSYFAACQGAQPVVCLEPSGAGSHPRMGRQFETFNQALSPAGIDVRLDGRTLQQLCADTEEYDIVVLHNTINHLNEEACRRLHLDVEARTTYEGLMAQIYTSCRPGGVLVVSDAARRNAFGLLGLRNPFAPTIEWALHQQPHVWTELLEQVGFTKIRITWDAHSRLGTVGQWMLGNRIGGFVTNSHFILHARKPGDAA